MNPNTQRNSYLLVVFIVMLAISLACNINSLIGQADPDLQLEGELTNQEKTDLQPFLGTFQSEIINVGYFPGEYCPDTLQMVPSEGKFTHEISGDTLIITSYGLPTNYTYNPDIGAFCREEFSDLKIGKDEFNTEILDCVSFQTYNGVKTSNHRRYYDVDGTPTLCFDQRSLLQGEARDQTGPGSDSSLVGECLATPNMYQVEFINISDEHSNETKKVCLGDFMIKNLSSDQLYIKYYHISDDASNHHEEWYSIVLEPGEIQKDGIGSQKWTDGKSTLDTFTNFIAVRSSIDDCATLIADENISKLSEYFVPLNDPCR